MNCKRSSLGFCLVTAPGRGRCAPDPDTYKAANLKNLKVLQSFAFAQPAQPRLVQSYVLTDGIRLRFGVFAQRPADRFAQKEAACVKTWLHARVQQVPIGLAFETHLTDDRRAAQPRVIATTPLEKDRPHLRRVA